MVVFCFFNKSYFFQIWAKRTLLKTFLDILNPFKTRAKVILPLWRWNLKATWRKTSDKSMLEIADELLCGFFRSQNREIAKQIFLCIAKCQTFRTWLTCLHHGNWHMMLFYLYIDSCTAKQQQELIGSFSILNRSLKSLKILTMLIQNPTKNAKKESSILSVLNQIHFGDTGTGFVNVARLTDLW